MFRVSACVLLLCGSAVASAQAPPRCFGGDAVASVPVHLGTALDLDAGCEYAREADGPYRRVEGRDRITGVLTALGWSPEEHTTVYARRRDAPEEIASVFVDHCTDFLLQAGGAFRVSPGAERDSIVVRRSGARCGAAELALHFVCASGNEMRDLPLGGGGSVTLPACPRWEVEARVGSRPAYPLGRLSSGGETPLQAYFAQSAPAPILRPTFEGGFGFEAVGDETLFEELRTALAADLLRVVRKRGVTSRAACAGEGEPVEVVVTERGLRLADAELAGELQQVYGDDGARMTLGLSRLQALAQELHVCLPASYGATEARGARGLSMTQVAQTEEIVERFGSAEVCVAHQEVRLSPSGQRATAGERQCVPANEGAVLAAAAGSVLEIPSGTVACSGREALESTEGGYVLRRGFVDVRVGGDCRTVATASLARVGVVDPGVDWVPVGIARRDSGAEHPSEPAWLGVPVDDPQTFARRRRGDTLRFRITTPQGFASAWNHPERGASTVITRFAPVDGGEPGEWGHARRPALRTLVTAEATCPLGEEEQDLEDGSDVQVDERLYVHLILDDGRAPRCLAHAAFRTWEPRVVTSVGRSERRQLRLGLLGDMRFGVFFSKLDAPALGVALPILYTHLHLKAGFLFEVSIPVTAGITWKDGGASRVSPALMVSMSWGWPNVAPRLLTAGFLVHAPWPHPEDEVWSFFAGVNLASLWDLAGGR